MALQFPSTPTNGQIYVDANTGNRYVYNVAHVRWDFVANAASILANDSQLLFTTSRIVTGSNGAYYDVASNTVYFNAVNASGNISANYFTGNGAFLTGVASDLSPAYNTANGAYDKANAAYTNSNTAFDVANAAFGSANNVAPQVAPAFQTANDAYTRANAAFGTANTAYTWSYQAFDKANGAFTSANNTSDRLDTAYTTVNAAFTQSNTDNVRLSAAYTSLNIAFLTANAAYNNANTKLSTSGGAITGDLSIVGTLTVSGNTYLLNANNIYVSDPLMYLAANNYSSDLVDIGLIANYVNTGGANVHTGLYREHENKEWYLFQGYDAEPINNHIGALSNNMTLAVLNADVRTSNLNLGGANAIVWISTSYGTANLSYTVSNAGFTVANAAFTYANNTGYYAGNNGDKGNATGLGDIFRVHSNTLSQNVTIYSGNNALAAGPITVTGSSTTLTIQPGARLAIV